jgi:hypothetical protein
VGWGCPLAAIFFDATLWRTANRSEEVLVLSQIFHEMITPHLGTTTQIEYGSYLALIGDET